MSENRFLKRPFQLGSLSCPSNIFYAPLAGCSDYPFRLMSARYQPGLMFCEMVKMDPLVRKDPGTLEMLKYHELMRPIGAQLCGSKPELAAPCAKIIEDLGFDSVDLNCGCPVDKVTKDGSGSALLKEPEKIGKILTEMVKAVKIPVTLKIRAGWDEEHLVAPLITRIAQEAGAVAICIHARTREQAYRGPAHWEWIRQCRQEAKTIKIIGNGDVFSPHAAADLFETCGVDAILIARGSMGQPWMVEDIIRHLQGEEPLIRSPLFRLEQLKDHFEKILHSYPGRKALLDMRRVSCWYVKELFGAAQFRGLINQAQTVEEVRGLLESLAMAACT